MARSIQIEFDQVVVSAVGPGERGRTEAEMNTAPPVTRDQRRSGFPSGVAWSEDVTRPHRSNQPRWTPTGTPDGNWRRPSRPVGDFPRERLRTSLRRLRARRAAKGWPLLKPDGDDAMVRPAMFC
jgi:hypothetical protein